MNDIVKTGTFDFNDILVRTIVEQSGEVLFRASDVAGVLRLDTHVMLRMVEDEDRIESTVLTSGGSQQAAFLREAGLYTVMLRSNRPEAVPFRRWVTREVLPQIRKTGSFGAAENERLARLEGEVAAMKFILAGKQNNNERNANNDTHHIQNDGQTHLFFRTVPSRPSSQSLLRKNLR
jgi:prophage antirepressor-like protein